MSSGSLGVFLDRHRVRLRALLILAAGGALLVQWALLAASPRGDFTRHVRWARRLAEGRFLYENGENLPYTPLWALVHLPLTLVPPHLAQVLLYPLGVLALCALVLALRRVMTPAPPDRLFRVEALALLLASRFILRDLFDCGPNLLVAALSWSAFVAWREGREGWAATALGLATALKWTPALLVVWFAMKRQWRMAAGSALAAALFTLAPILVEGPRNYARDMSAWASNLLGAMRSADPFSGVLGPDTAGNIALRPALARALAASGVPAAVAFVAILAALGALIALALWSLRSRSGGRGDSSLASEYAAAALLALLLSPVAWRSHAVAALAALRVVSRRLIVGGERSPFLVAWLAAWVLAILVLNPTITGGTLQALLDQASVTTWLLVALFFLVLPGE